MMKPTLLLATALLTATLVACGGDEPAKDAPKNAADAGAGAEAVATSEASGPRPFKMKSGVVEMTLNMMGEQKQTMYFDEYGARQAMVMEIEVMGQKSRTVTINADGWNITYDPDKKEGTKTRAFATSASVNGVPSLEGLSDEMKSRYKLKEIEHRTIAGHEAQGYELEAMNMPMKVWVWDGLPMRTEVTMGGKEPIVTEVTAVQVDAEIPADRFVVPADVKLTER